VLFVANAAFNNLGHPFYSTWINWGRHTLGTILPVILFAGLFGASGVLIGQAVGGVVFGLLSLWLVRRLMNREVAAAPVDSFQPQARAIQLLHHRR
jgi:Na+-driven multidrug efflux pump